MIGIALHYGKVQPLGSGPRPLSQGDSTNLAAIGILCYIIGVCIGIYAFYCGILILIAAFQDEIWKGIVCLLCGFYALYYMLVEFDHEHKWRIVLCNLFGGVIAAVFFAVGGSLMRH